MKNPGFESNLNGWTADPGLGQFAWQGGTALDEWGYSTDATACPFSGSLKLPPASEDHNQRIWQCVAVTSNTDYNFGISTSGAGDCEVDFYSSANCSGTIVTNRGLGQINNAWADLTVRDDNYNAVSVSSKTAQSALVYCHSDEQYGGRVIDNVYLSPAPGRY